MGSQSSKIESPANNNAVNTENTVRFSQSFINSLQDSPETDSTRAKALEIEIQSRVNAELRRIQSVAAKEYAELQATISAEEQNESNQLKDPTDQDKSEIAEAGNKLRQLGREAVLNDLFELKSKLERSKQVQELDDDVTKAKNDVISCLIENDRRPLDCWAEVEKFKKEVARIENRWIQKIVS